jgi:hypothetical protein
MPGSASASSGRRLHESVDVHVLARRHRQQLQACSCTYNNMDAMCRSPEFKRALAMMIGAGLTLAVLNPFAAYFVGQTVAKLLPIYAAAMGAAGGLSALGCANARDNMCSPGQCPPICGLSASKC